MAAALQLEAAERQVEPSGDERGVEVGDQPAFMLSSADRTSDAEASQIRHARARRHRSEVHATTRPRPGSTAIVTTSPFSAASFSMPGPRAAVEEPPAAEAVEADGILALLRVRAASPALIGHAERGVVFRKKKQRKGSLVSCEAPPIPVAPQGGNEAALKHKEEFMNNTYRIRQCPRILLTSDRQPCLETCRMRRQGFGFDWSRARFLLVLRASHRAGDRVRGSPPAVPGSADPRRGAGAAEQGLPDARGAGSSPAPSR